MYFITKITLIDNGEKQIELDKTKINSLHLYNDSIKFCSDKFPKLLYCEHSYNPIGTTWLMKSYRAIICVNVILADNVLLYALSIPIDTFTAVTITGLV